MRSHLGVRPSRGLLFLAIVVLALSGKGAARPARASQAGTALSNLAASMAPGTWAELQTTGFDGLLSEGAGYIISYSDKMVWDGVRRQAYFLGAGHAAGAGAGKFVRYDEATNSWTALPSGPAFFSDKGGPSHSYDHLVAVPSLGKLYYRLYYSNHVYGYDVATDTWGGVHNLPDIPAGNQLNGAGAMDYFPERHSILFLDGDWGVWEYSLVSGQWTYLLGTVVGHTHDMGDVANLARYNPITHSWIFGFGNQDGPAPADGPRRSYSLAANGTVTGLPNAPFGVALTGPAGSGILTPDPVTGDLILYGSQDGVTGLAAVYKQSSGAWETIPAGPQTPPFFANSVDGPVFGTASVALPEHGVMMFVDYESAQSKVYLYKYSSGGGAPPSAPTITTPPDDRTVTEGQTATFSVVASGATPLAYQWQRNGTDIPGATGESYITPATTLSESGATFRVVVTNPAGSATSGAATLFVSPSTGDPGSNSGRLCGSMGVDLLLLPGLLRLLRRPRTNSSRSRQGESA